MPEELTGFYASARMHEAIAILKEVAMAGGSIMVEQARHESVVGLSPGFGLMERQCVQMWLKHDFAEISSADV